MKRLVRLWDVRRLLSACRLNSAFLISLPHPPPSVRRERLVYPYIVKTGAQLHSFWAFNGDWKKFALCVLAPDSLPSCLSRARAGGSVGSYPAPKLSSCKNGPGAYGRRLFRDGKPEKPFWNSWFCFILIPRLGFSSPLQHHQRAITVNENEYWEGTRLLVYWHNNNEYSRSVITQRVCI